MAREVFRVEGGRPLHGRVAISGSKNAALKLMAAATLTGERCRLTNVPDIEDVRVMAETLRDLGVVVERPEPNTYEIASGDVDWLFVPLEAAAKMRASFILLGPLLSRFGRVIISNPGGDRIGRRPVNLHVEAMRALGANIDYRNGYYFASAPGRLRGGDVTFPMVSVMGTENAILAATLAAGTTRIQPAAQEPEVDDLIAFLCKMGADIERPTPDTVVVNGQRRLRGATHEVLPDRIEAGTFVAAAAVTGGQVTLDGAPCDQLGAFLEVLSTVGVSVSCDADTIEVVGAPIGSGAYRAVDITTAPYPGLATDLQPPTVVLLSQATRHQPRPRGHLRGPPRVALRAGAHGRHGGDDRQPPRRPQRARPPARRRRRDRRPARRCLAHPGRPGRRGHLDHPRCAPRSAGV